MEDLKEEIQKMKLIMQQLEDRITKLESSESDSGIYLDGCSEEVINFMKTEGQKGKEVKE